MELSSILIVIGLGEPTILHTKQRRRDRPGMGFRQKKRLKLFESILMEEQAVNKMRSSRTRLALGGRHRLPRGLTIKLAHNGKTVV